MIPPRTAAWGWTLVGVAALLEVIWPLALTEADGITRPGWAVLGIGIALVSLAVLTVALRSLPLGSAYAVWMGLGAVGVFIAGVIVLDEPITAARAICLALIVAGVTGLTLDTSPARPNRPDRDASVDPVGHGAA